MADGRQYESVRRYFSEVELTAMHEALVQSVGDVKNLRSEKTQANTVINANIKGTEKAVFDLQEKLANGYEVIDVEVIAIMDTPAPGQKQILRVDTNAVIRTEPMTVRQRQPSFGFQEPEATE